MIDYDPKEWLGIAFRVHGTIAPRLVGRTLFVALVGVAAAYAYQQHSFKIPAITHTLIGLALGLLLVFRTNASYDRFWEGRKLLGSMVNRTRDFARQLAAFLPDPDEVTTARMRAARRYVVLFYALGMQGLRGERDLAPLKALVAPGDTAWLEASKARGPVALARASRELQSLRTEGKLTEIQVMLLDGNLTSLMDSLGACERIVRTPIPLAYAQHIKILVLLFCATIPFAMVDAMKWATPVASGILAYALFGIDEIGVEIEDPFGYDANDLPIDRIQDVIDGSTADIIANG